MAKPKTLEQLRAEKEQVETQLAQEQHKLERLENRKKYLEKGERQKRTHRLCNLGGTIESLAPETKESYRYQERHPYKRNHTDVNCFMRTAPNPKEFFTTDAHTAQAFTFGTFVQIQ